MSDTLTADRTATGVTPVLPLRAAADGTPTSLWNDSADLRELERSISFGAVGATCNPVIALTTIEKNLDVWAPRIAQLAAEHPTAGESELGWLAIEAMSIEAAALLLPAFRASGGRDGRLSVQTDPRLHRDADALVAQAVHFSELAENIIVKIPATAIGIRAIEEATFRGVSINATVSFTVAQAVAVAEAIERGLDRRSAEGLPEHEFGSVVTIMGGRLDDWIKASVAADRRLVEPGHLEWAGVAALKKAYAIFRERGYRSRILSAAFRNHLQWSELVGGDLVVSPPFEWQLLIDENRIAVDLHRIDAPVAPEILETLLELPEFRRAYLEDGMTVDEFDSFGATRRTLRQFLDADARLDALVRDVLLPPV
ncbi:MULTISPECIES: transaldolase family protein [unclassified Rathayibacter]|uniref:transaldolase family protein n=1 Tax=unclassified Rathayibacter TaxID=2609250 RepID=UPI0006F875D7|nr:MULTISPECIES: transaldolase family protein [unclassified Rathayibacter]KQP95947.1 transaldolase [Rathayibacter sp. Leaf294]KQS07668.1 transaldolase [Rathayibacter sp. Leaf185]